ncbi:putative outer membrane protein, FadL family [Psychrobacter arcticus 273-4]|uniref:Putative outer membrane protein, FadL family n=1 Tax=Psychrobacter arcticus (strain DSM 17307 / VKM B-2377 / 273-4) TaxID=259536 RepID=Q4FRU3_PSYA2|nr:outer membrane protein transport protein [Psychrobacter arcticus]AAZ19265.1 putative outer membrane protein, FadL family [Psychrobacter arcticus 273-4]
MGANFNLKTLTVAIATLSIASVASAAGLDRSGQDITAFLQDGVYAEAVYTYIDGDVTGKDSSGKEIDDIAESYDFFRYGVKADINDTFSVGVLYDEPFGAAAKYSGDNKFVNAKGEGTNVEVRTENLTAIMGAKLGENKNFQVYGGPVAQRVQADVKLRGDAYQAANGYTAHISAAQDYGWLAGVAYSKPEIALQAALTYRSEIDHTLPISEKFPALGAAANRVGEIDITTPKSVNFDFQTGINPTMLATAKVRWVPWSDFEIVPPLYNQASKLSLVSYDEDQWLVELGLAKRLTPVLAMTGTVGWDSGAGNPVSSLGPIEGYYSAGLGAKYNLTDNWAISAGGKYLWFGDAKGQIPNKTVVSNFEDNDGFALGVKLSYQAKQSFN